MKLTKKSKIELPGVSLSVKDLQALLPICIHGLPDIDIPEETRDVLSTLVCLSINPMRPGFEMLEII